MTTQSSSRRRVEQKIQTAIVMQMERRFDCFVFHVPNGGGRTKLEAIALKEMGVKAGVPDLVVLARDGRSFFIEVKERVVREATALSDTQKRVIPHLRERGFTVVVVDEARAALSAGEAFGLEPRRAPVRTVAEARTGF